MIGEGIRLDGKTTLTCNETLSPIDYQEQHHIFASMAAQVHGETIEVDDSDLDLEDALGAMIDAGAAENGEGAGDASAAEIDEGAGGLPSGPSE